MAVQINVAANQSALAKSIQQGVDTYNRRFAGSNQINLQINQKAFSQPLGRITGDVKDFNAAIAASNARVIAFGASTAVLGSVISGFKALANATIEVEKNLADINRILQLSTDNLQDYAEQLFDVAKSTSTSFDQASKALLEFSRQGLAAEETLKRTKDALILSRLAGMDAADSVDALTATVNGFAATGITTSQVLNKLIAVEQSFAVSARDLSQGLSRTGQAAQEAGVSIDELNALITTAQQKTARGGAVIGNALKTIFTRLQRSETLDQLEDFKVAVRDIEGGILPATVILQNFANVYEKLGDAQRAQLSEQVAGVYQVNILKALVSDLNSEQGIYNRALLEGARATNQAEIANAKLNQTLSALLQQTSTGLTELSSNIGKISFEPLAKYVVNIANETVETFNEILTGEGIGSNFAKGLLKGIRNLIGGPGAIGAAYAFVGLIQNSFKYITQALPQIAGVTTETQNRKNIEQAILQIMQQQGMISKALAGSMGNQTSQASILLNLAKQQTLEYQRQTALAQSLAVSLSRSGVGVGPAGLSLKSGRSGGFIPSLFAEQEKSGARKGGYSPGRVVPAPKNVGGVMNTAEDVKYVDGFKQPFINPPEKSRAGKIHRINALKQTGIDPYMAGGFIPNFLNKNPRPKMLVGNKFEKDFFEQLGVSAPDNPQATLDLPKGVLANIAKDKKQELKINSQSEYGDVKLAVNKDSLTSMASKYIRANNQHIMGDVAYTDTEYAILYQGEIDKKISAERQLSALVKKNKTVIKNVDPKLKDNNGKLTDDGRKTKVRLTFFADGVTIPQPTVASPTVASSGFIPNFVSMEEYLLNRKNTNIFNGTGAQRNAAIKAGVAPNEIDQYLATRFRAKLAPSAAPAQAPTAAPAQAPTAAPAQAPTAAPAQAPTAATSQTKLVGPQSHIIESVNWTEWQSVREAAEEKWIEDNPNWDKDMRDFIVNKVETQKKKTKKTLNIDDLDVLRRKYAKQYILKNRGWRKMLDAAAANASGAAFEKFMLQKLIAEYPDLQTNAQAGLLGGPNAAIDAISQAQNTMFEFKAELKPDLEAVGAKFTRVFTENPSLDASLPWKKIFYRATNLERKEAAKSVNNYIPSGILGKAFSGFIPNFAKIDRNFLRDLILLSHKNVSEPLNKEANWVGNDPLARKLNVFRGVRTLNHKRWTDDIKRRRGVDINQLSGQILVDEIFNPVPAEEGKDAVKSTFVNSDIKDILRHHQVTSYNPDNLNYMPFVSASYDEKVAKEFAGGQGINKSKQMGLSRILNKKTLSALYKKYGKRKTKNYLFDLTRVGGGRGLGFDLNDILGKSSDFAYEKEIPILNKGFIPNFGGLDPRYIRETLARIKAGTSGFSEVEQEGFLSKFGAVTDKNAISKKQVLLTKTLLGRKLNQDAVDYIMQTNLANLNADLRSGYLSGAVDFDVPRGYEFIANKGFVPNFANIKSKYGTATLGETDPIDLEFFSKSIGRKIKASDIVSIEDLSTVGKGNAAGLYGEIASSEAMKGKGGIFGYALPQNRPVDPKKAKRNKLARLNARFPQVYQRLLLGGETYISDNFGKTAFLIRTPEDLLEYQSEILRMVNPAVLTLRKFSKGFIPNFNAKGNAIRGRNIFQINWMKEQAKKRGISLNDPNAIFKLGVEFAKKYPNEQLMFGMNGGFIPNFAYKQAVMNFEERMSGEDAIYSENPFPHIRNKSQPTFASAIADHGGLGNAISDSMHNQSAAKLINRGFIPNFAYTPYEATDLRNIQGTGKKATSMDNLIRVFPDTAAKLIELNNNLSTLSSDTSLTEEAIQALTIECYKLAHDLNIDIRGMSSKLAGAGNDLAAAQQAQAAAQQAQTAALNERESRMARFKNIYETPTSLSPVQPTSADLDQKVNEAAQAYLMLTTEAYLTADTQKTYEDIIRDAGNALGAQKEASDMLAKVTEEQAKIRSENLSKFELGTGGPAPSVSGPPADISQDMIDTMISESTDAFNKLATETDLSVNEQERLRKVILDASTAMGDSAKGEEAINRAREKMIEKLSDLNKLQTPKFLNLFNRSLLKTVDGQRLTTDETRKLQKDIGKLRERYRQGLSTEEELRSATENLINARNLSAESAEIVREGATSPDKAKKTFEEQLNMARSALTFLGPIIAGQLEQFMYKDKSRAELSESERMGKNFMGTGLTAISTGFSIGGPWGAAVGAAVALTQSFSALKLSTQELIQSIDERSKKELETLSTFDSAVEKLQSATESQDERKINIAAEEVSRLLNTLPIELKSKIEKDLENLDFSSARNALEDLSIQTKRTADSQISLLQPVDFGETLPERSFFDTMSEQIILTSVFFAEKFKEAILNVFSGGEDEGDNPQTDYSRGVRGQSGGSFLNNKILKANNGVFINGSGSGDKYPALLENGEYVLNRNAVKALGGKSVLDNLNFNHAPRFQTGGSFPTQSAIPGGKWNLDSGEEVRRLTEEIRRLADTQSEYNKKLNKDLNDAEQGRGPIAENLIDINNGFYRWSQRAKQVTSKLIEIGEKVRKMEEDVKARKLEELREARAGQIPPPVKIETGITTPESLLYRNISSQEEAFKANRASYLESFYRAKSQRLPDLRKYFDNIDDLQEGINNIVRDTSLKSRQESLNKLKTALLKIQGVTNASADEFIRYIDTYSSSSADAAQLLEITNLREFVDGTRDFKDSVEAVTAAIKTGATSAIELRRRIEQDVIDLQNTLARERITDYGKLQRAQLDIKEKIGVSRNFNRPYEAARFERQSTELEIRASEQEALRAYEERYSTLVKEISGKTKDSQDLFYLMKDLRNAEEEGWSLQERQDYIEDFVYEMNDLTLKEKENLFRQIQASEETLNNSKLKAEEDRKTADYSLEKRNEELRKQTDALYQFKSSISSMSREADVAAAKIAYDAPRLFAEGMTTALMEVAKGTKSVGDAFRDVAIDFGYQLMQQAIGALNQKLISGILGQGSSLLGLQSGGAIRANNGLYVNGSGSGDRYPAMLENGEYVLNRNAVKMMGGKNVLDKLNFQNAPRFAAGGGFFTSAGYDTKKDDYTGDLLLNGRSAGKIDPDLYTARAFEEDPYFIKQKEKAVKKFQERVQKRFQGKMARAQLISSAVGALGAMFVSAGLSQLASTAANAASQSASAASNGQLIAAEPGSVADFNINAVTRGDISASEFNSFVKANPSQFKLLDMETGNYNVLSSGSRISNRALVSAFSGVNSYLQSQRSGGRQMGGYIGFNSGGFVPYGSRLNDTIPALLTGGEYVMNNSAVKKYGLGTMNSMNAGSYQSGGMASNSATTNNNTNNNATNISINVDRSGKAVYGADTSSYKQNDIQISKQMARQINAIVLKTMVNEKRYGGELYKDPLRS